MKDEDAMRELERGKDANSTMAERSLFSVWATCLFETLDNKHSQKSSPIRTKAEARRRSPKKNVAFNSFPLSTSSNKCCRGL